MVLWMTFLIFLGYGTKTKDPVKALSYSKKGKNSILLSECEVLILILIERLSIWGLYGMCHVFLFEIEK